MNELLKKKYGNVVEGPMGFLMPEKIARQIDEASKGLPKDFTYRRRGFATGIERKEAADRTEVSIITSDAIDRDRECVLPSGGDWSTYNKCVPVFHDYKQLPAGYNQWIKPDGRTIQAKTQYPTKPDDWGDAPWMPSAVWHLINQPVPTMGDKSIGFLPLNIRGATPEEKSLRPEMDGIPVIDRWMGIEYSAVLVPANAEAQIISVGKAFKAGLLEWSIADFLIKGSGYKFSSTHVNLPDDVAAKCRQMAARIPEEHLAEDGREDQIHCTVKYGLHTQDAEKVRKALADYPPVSMKLGKSAVFKGDKHDVVMCAVDSPDLHALHKHLSANLPHTDTYPAYQPHVTLAFVRKGLGDMYKDMDDVDGLSMTCGKLTFANRDGKETHIPLTGTLSVPGNPDTTQPAAVPATPVTNPPTPTDNPGMTVQKQPEGKASESGNAGAIVSDQDEPMPPCPKCLTNTGVISKDSDGDDDGDIDESAGDKPAHGYFCDYCGTEFDAPKPDKKSVRGVTLNRVGLSHAEGLVGEGKIDDGPWGFTATDRHDAKPEDYLATDDSAAPDTEAHWKYPVSKGGKVYRRGVAAADSRASAAGATEVADAAKRLMTAIQAKQDADAKALAVDAALKAPYITVETIKAVEKRRAEARKSEVPKAVRSAFNEGLNRALGRI